MEQTIKLHDEVWSKDDKKLGMAMMIHHRPKDVDPDVKFYEAYLEIEDFELGMSYYIPTEFISGHDEATGRVIVDVSLKQVLNNTWGRRPRFVAGGMTEAEALPRE